MAVLEVLDAVVRGQRLDLALASRSAELDPRERRWAHELAYGVCRFRGRLDAALARVVRVGLSELDPSLLSLLRMGVWQLRGMSGVPPWAAISQTVEQARGRSGEGASRLANAVLRRVAAELPGLTDPMLFPDPGADPAGHLSAWGSHPRWLVERWITRWGLEEATRIVEADNEIPTVVLHPWGFDEATLAERLAAQGIEGSPVGGGLPGVRLPRGTDVAATLASIPAWVQDPAAALVVDYAAPRAGDRVADLCAAPGGKTLALAARGAYVLAADPSSPRLDRVVEGIRRVGAGDRVLPLLGTAEVPAVRGADLVLLDVPCSGTGTLRRHPDARWRLVPEAITGLAALQARLLEGAAHGVRPGGLLVYSTCTLEPEENEEQVRRFLSAHPGFRLAPPEAGRALPFVDAEGFLRVLPRASEGDGAFSARMERIA